MQSAYTLYLIGIKKIYEYQMRLPSGSLEKLSYDIQVGINRREFSRLAEQETRPDWQL